MAWAEKLPSGKHRGVYRDASGRKRSAGTFTRKPEAERQAGNKEVAERKSPTPAGADKLTWGEREASWDAARIVRKSTGRSDKARLRDHVRPRWEKHVLRSISTDDVQKWVTELSNSGMTPLDGGEVLLPVPEPANT
ncbi:hypothetical protein AB0H00_08880 [Nocardia sp. NPDC023852]|uniref:hypothetical protein n=1 Tax=Nocardia sp. NPDC023852 TaxID=3154697 RepID=UPI0033E1C58C